MFGRARIPAHVGLGLCLVLAVFELLDLFSAGVKRYVKNLWHFTFWAIFVSYAIMYVNLVRSDFGLSELRDCSELCQATGYCDDWREAEVMTTAITFLAWSSCLQVIGLTKFASDFIPKLGFGWRLVRKACIEVAFLLIFLSSFIFLCSVSC